MEPRSTDAPVTDPPAPTDAPDVPAAPGTGRRRRGSLPDLLRSMLVLLVLVAAAVLLLPRPGARPVASVDVAAEAAALADRVGFTLAVPRGLPPSWTATGARLLDGTDGTPSWRVTYQTGTGRPVGFVQGHHPTRAWENHMVVDGRESGTTVIDGRTWVLRSRGDRGTTNLVLREREQTLIVTGRAERAELEALVRSLP